MNRQVWDEHKVQDQIKKLDADGKISFMSMQKVECLIEKDKSVDYIIAVFKKI